MKTLTKLSLFLATIMFAFGTFNSAYAQTPTSVQDFGTGTGSFLPGTGTTNVTSTNGAVIPHPTVGSSFIGLRPQGGGVFVENTNNPFGADRGSFLRAAASTEGAAVHKVTPILNYTGGTTFYVSFYAMFGAYDGGNTPATGATAAGSWEFHAGVDNATFSNNGNIFRGASFAFLQFQYRPDGVLRVNSRVNNGWANTDPPKDLDQGVVYFFEIIGNNSSARVYYTHNGVPRYIEPNTFDVFIDGEFLHNWASAGTAENTAIGTNIQNISFMGLSSANNQANIFLDDIVVFNTIPSVIPVIPPAVATPTFTPGEGFFVGTQNVTISTTTADASIFFTTNGTNPNAGSTPFVAGTPIALTETTTIRAIAILEPDQSEIAEATFTRLRNDIAWEFTGATTGAPTVTFPNITASVMTGRDTAAINTGSNSGGAYAGATGGNNLIHDVQNVGTQYFEFTLTPAQAFGFNLEEISFGIRRTATGPRTWQLRSSQDGFTTTLAQRTTDLADATWTLDRTTGLNLSSSTPVTFRIFLYGGTSATAGGNARIDDVRLGVSTFEVPTIVADRNEIDFDEVFAGILTATENIVVTATHFTEAITFAIEGPDAAAFTYDDAEWATSGTLEITFAPDEIRNFEAAIRFTTTGTATDLTVPLVGIGIDPTDPLIHVSMNNRAIDSIGFGTTPLNTDVVQTITIQGFNLDEDIALTLGDGANFSVVPDAGWDPRDGGDLIITFSAETPDTVITTLTVTSQGATTRSVGLGAISVGPVLQLAFRNDMVHLVNTDVSTIQVPITAGYLFEEITIESSNPLFVPSVTTLPTSTTTYTLEVNFTGTARGETATVTISTGDTVRTQMFISITDDVLIGWNFQDTTAEGRSSNFGTASNLGVVFNRDDNTRLTSDLGARAGLVSSYLDAPLTTPRYWQTGPINTTSLDPNYTLVLTHRQHGSNTGPRDWQLQYRIGTTGDWVNIGDVYSVINPGTLSPTNPRPLFANVLPAEAHNVAELYLRWLVVSDVRIFATGTATNVATGGTSHMSEVLLTWAPVLVADRHSVAFGDQYIGTNTTQSVIVTGANLLPYPIAVVDAGLAPNFTVATGEGWNQYTGGTINITFAPTTVGEIRAVLFLYADDERKDSIVLTGTGVQGTSIICPIDIEETTVALFPNPVVDVLNIVAEQAIATVRIYNLAGQVVVQQHGNRDYVNMSSLPRGTYVVRIVFENGTILTRTVVK